MPCERRPGDERARSRRRQLLSSTVNRFGQPKAAKIEATIRGKRFLVKRHLAVDTLGLILAVVIHTADWQDQDGACSVLEELGKKFHRLKVIFGDAAYGRANLPAYVRDTFGWILQPVLRPVGVKHFVVLSKRWIVERTFAWLARYRRHSKDYEKTTVSSEAFTYLAMITLMSKRLARAET